MADDGKITNPIEIEVSRDGTDDQTGQSLITVKVERDGTTFSTSQWLDDIDIIAVTLDQRGADTMREAREIVEQIQDRTTEPSRSWSQMPYGLYNDLTLRLAALRQACEDAAHSALENDDPDRKRFWTHEHDATRDMLSRVISWWGSGGKGQE